MPYRRGGLDRAGADIESYAAGNPDVGIADLELAVTGAGHGIVGFGSRLGDAIVARDAGQRAVLRRR